MRINKDVVFDQLGGYNNVIAMLGLKFYSVHNNTLALTHASFKGIAITHISLTQADFYDIHFMNRSGLTKKEFKNIHCSKLKEIVERELGIYLTLYGGLKK